MSYGLQWFNNNNVETVSDSKYGLVYIGDATWDTTTQADAYSDITADSGSYGSSSGRGICMNYYISSPTPPVVFIQGGNNWASGAGIPYCDLCSIKNVGGNQWQIVIAYKGGTVITGPRVACFAKLQGVGPNSGWGMRAYDGSGNRTWDTNERMLTIDRRVVLPADSSFGTAGIVQSTYAGDIPSPMVMCSAEVAITGTRNTYVAKLDQSNVKEYITGWNFDGTQLSRTSNALQLGTKYYDGAYGANTNSLPATTLYIISGSRYS